MDDELKAPTHSGACGHSSAASFATSRKRAANSRRIGFACLRLLCFGLIVLSYLSVAYAFLPPESDGGGSGNPDGRQIRGPQSLRLLKTTFGRTGMFISSQRRC